MRVTLAAMAAPDPLPFSSLRWQCPDDALDFETTDDLEPLRGVIGQPSAVEALRFGIACDAPGQNVFVRGLAGSGRMTLVAHVLDELRTFCRVRLDRCYVRNFRDPGRPRLITLPGGTGRRFRRAMNEFCRFIVEELGDALAEDEVTARRKAVEDQGSAELKGVVDPFQERVQEAGLALAQVQVGSASRPVVLPLVDGEPVPPEALAKLVSEGKLSEEDAERLRGEMQRLGEELGQVSREADRIRARTSQRLQELGETIVRDLVGRRMELLAEEFTGDDVREFLDEVLDDVVESALGGTDEDPRERYSVNVVLDRDGDDCPVVVETAPTLANLLGSVDRRWTDEGVRGGDHGTIRGGSLLRADGGYLVLEARDVLSEAGAWQALVRTLRTGLLEIVPGNLSMPFGGPVVQPEPIPLNVRVILLGDGQTYAFLDRGDPDFAHLFKVLADFDSSIERDAARIDEYARVLTRVQRDENLPRFHREAVARLVEHGARVAARAGKLTARLGRVVDIAREAAFLAREETRDVVSGVDVIRAVRRSKDRGRLASDRFVEFVERGTILVRTRGREVGQVNGLAVIHAGPLTYGFPARITCTVGPGTAGLVDIEGRASLSGSIHTKGFHILEGLLRRLLGGAEPLHFNASLAFEQSYGGIDGDSASGAEVCCLLSALADAPIRQELAITGAVDQFGHLQAIGGVNEKIEGFFDVCAIGGFTGRQGVIIPVANAGDLMLRRDVAEACGRREFHVWAVADVLDALRLLTGTPPGDPNAASGYSNDSLLGRARDRVAEFRKALRSDE